MGGSHLSLLHRVAIVSHPSSMYSVYPFQAFVITSTNNANGDSGLRHRFFNTCTLRNILVVCYLTPPLYTKYFWSRAHSA